MNLINNIHKIAFRGDTQTAAPVDKDLQAVPTPIKEESLQRTPQKDTFTTTTTKVPEYSAPTATKPVSTSIFYINDIHGRIGNMARIYTAKAEYDSQMVNSTSDKFVLSAGDISAGADNHIIKAANTYMSGMGLDATSDGNHEYDANPPEIAEMKKDAKFRSLGMNLIIPKGNPLEGIIEKSYIAEKNGNKYAVIGLAPPDMHERIRDNDSRKQIKLEEFGKTLTELQKLSDNFKDQGIDKVILLSHCGYTKDQQIAKEISGIDVIIGGHTHDLITGIEEGKNLFYSKTNEPVVITQGGKDGEYFGVLNIEFNDKGVINKVQNSVTESSKFKRSPLLKAVFNKILGKPEHLGEITKACGPTKDRLIDPNPNAFFFMDACRNELGTDLALINAGNVRGFFEVGQLDSRQVFEVVPLKNTMVTLKMTEKEVIDSLKNGAKSFINPGSKPSIVMPSGLKYTVSRQGEIKAASFVDKTGKETAIDVNNPNPNKIYTVATDDFFASGGDGLMKNKIETNEIDKKLDFDKDKLACDYIKKINKPIEIVDDGRITVVD